MTIVMGHARAYVAFDLLKRVLTHAGYNIHHVQNFTDIDDKSLNAPIKTTACHCPYRTIY